ncbi:MAG: trypsin-like peptidase domain-containing protein [Bacteroidetes bacterium]|nr:trypsin-like peptidase domain-containing protein [Bacteroidota bacterium]
MRKIIYIFFLLHLPSVFLHFTFSQTLPSASLDKIKKATVFIEVKHHFILTGEELSSSGSGFFINDKGWIATNYHVIQSLLGDYNATYPTKINQIKITRNSGTSEYKTYSATIVSIDKDNDLAILAVSDSLKLPYVEIDTSKLNELASVWIFGFPFGDEFTVLQRGPEITVNNGSVSALRHDDRNELNSLQVDAVINHGNSGGPVVNENGKVVGIINSMMGNTRINFAVPSHYLGKLMKDIPDGFSISETTHLKIKTIPEDAQVFVDREKLFSKDGYKDDFKPNGLHSIFIMKKGYESFMKEVSFTGKYEEAITLSSEKNLVVPAKDKSDKKEITTASSITNTEEVLMKENFDDAKRFDGWEQSTGGEKNRTWYLEDGKLNQFENNGTLHAIYLGDKNWNDYTVKAKVKITNEGGGMEADSRAGIIFRETENGFYLLRIHKETNKAQLAYHCKSPFGWFIITEKKLDDDIEIGKWYRLSASVSGNSISCFLDGKNLFNVNASYSMGGRVGFYSVESKPVFDSLTVVKTKNIETGNISQTPSLVSFWFSDNFDLKSNWWYQYKINNGAEELSPLYMVDGSFAITEECDTPQIMEFTKYKLADFVMSIVVSIDEGKKDALFEIILRKDNQNQISLRFEKEKNKLSLIQNENGKEKILKEKNIVSKIFGSTASIQVKADGNSISVGSDYSTWLSYDNKNILMSAGRIGFESQNVRLAFHQLTLSSIAEQPVKEKGKK